MRDHSSFTEFKCQQRIEAIRIAVDDAFDAALQDDNFGDWTCVYEALASLAGALHREASRVASYAGKAVLKDARK